MVPLKLMILLLSTACVLGDVTLRERPQHHNIDPISVDSSKESVHHGNDKRTILGDLLTHNNYALARHFVYRNGVKYLLGYGQVDLRYMPHFKPVFVRQRFSAMPWHANNVHYASLKPSVVTNNDAWKAIVAPKPVASDVPAYTPSIAPPENQPQHQPAPLKLNLPVLPFGAMFLTPIVPHHYQQQLEYYPLPIQPAEPAVHIENPHHHYAHVAVIFKPDHQTIAPGGSYEVHGYQPHQHHVNIAPVESHQEHHLPAHYHHHLPPQEGHYDDQPGHDHQPTTYVSSLEFHGNQPTERVIQPGQSDVQIPLHLVQHPNYRPEDYYNYPGEGPRIGHVAGERSGGAIENGRGEAPFKPSQIITSYKRA